MTVSHKKDSLPTYVTEGVNKFSDCQYDWKQHKNAQNPI